MSMSTPVHARSHNCATHKQASTGHIADRTELAREGRASLVAEEATGEVDARGNHETSPGTVEQLLQVRFVGGRGEPPCSLENIGDVEKALEIVSRAVHAGDHKES